MSEFYFTKRIEYNEQGILEFDKDEFIKQNLDNFTIQKESIQITFHESYAVVVAKLSKKSQGIRPDYIVIKRTRNNRF